jgi:hypothetical protein
MRIRLVLAGALAASFVFGLFGGHRASAQLTPGGYWYGIVTVHNQTSSTIHYGSRIGDGDWEQQTLEPGRYWYYWNKYSYANENRSPILEVRFDSDMSDGISWRQYSLKRYNAAYVDASFGRHYDFKDRGGDQIDLYSR